ncbi:hypothetical protein [Kitasatospora cinereorecta]|uniref:RimK family alpha-L-glutamate ligase n=1 Tax=Kitasatospora cinereorecta TaxID=285560 RepID=A0ABW0VQT8_9ACTN
MILLWGICGDDPMDCVRVALERRGAPYLFLDQQAVGETALDLVVDGSEDGPQGQLRTRDWTAGLHEITSVYLRPYDTRQMLTVRDTPEDSAERRHAAALDDALLTWLELTPALVLNRPGAMASNTSKPYQAMLMAAAGTAVPDTLVTTVEEAVRSFADRHGEVVYKSASGVRSIVSRLSARRDAELGDVAGCPTQFQEFVDGADLRVHVVGEHAFATEVIAVGDDYRYSDAQPRAVELDDAELKQCLALSRALDLPLAGIDLRRTPDGASVFFEVNPSPGFTYYQAATGQPIAEAIASLLAEPGFGQGRFR